MLSTPTSRPPFGAEPVEPDLVPAHNRAVMPITMTDRRGRDGTHRDERCQRYGAAGHATIRPVVSVATQWMWFLLLLAVEVAAISLICLAFA